jgi:hypothetical protein
MITLKIRETVITVVQGDFVSVESATAPETDIFASWEELSTSQREEIETWTAKLLQHLAGGLPLFDGK